MAGAVFNSLAGAVFNSPTGPVFSMLTLEEVTTMLESTGADEEDSGHLHLSFSLGLDMVFSQAGAVL